MLLQVFGLHVTGVDGTGVNGTGVNGVGANGHETQSTRNAHRARLGDSRGATLLSGLTLTAGVVG